MAFHSAHPGVHHAPHAHPNINLYDTFQLDEPAAAISESSPVLHQHQYPHSCIPQVAPRIAHRTGTSVPNMASHYPNQPQPHAPYGGPVAPGQPWARPVVASAQQAPAPAPYHAQHRRSSSHHSQSDYTQNFSRRASVEHHASAAYVANPAYPVVAQHQPNHDDQSYYHQQPATSGFAPSQSAQVCADSYPQTPMAQLTSHQPAYGQDYHPAQYQTQHHVEPQPGNQTIAYEPVQTYGMFAPEDHAQQQQLAQTAEYEPYKQEDNELLLNAPFDYNLQSHAGQAQVSAVESQNHEHVKLEHEHVAPEHEQYDHSHTQYHSNQHVEYQAHEYHQHQYHEQQQQQQQHVVAQPNMNMVNGYESSHQHTLQYADHSRRNSEVSQHEPASFQHPAPAAHHPHPQESPYIRSHSRSSSSCSSEPPMKKLAIASPTALCYPDESTPEAPTQTQIVSAGEHHLQPEETPARQGARCYQTDLEIQFLERAIAMGQVIGPSYTRSLPEAGCHQAQSPQRMPPIVPSQAHERPVPVPVVAACTSAHPIDKKDAQVTPKKPALACLFCRKRKIACGPPPPDSPDKTCNQCARRKQPCEYPTESRRGIRKPVPKEPVEDDDDDEASSPSAMRFVKHDPNEKSKDKSKNKTRRKRSHELVD